MWRDPIVEEVRRVRAEFAARFGNDLGAMMKELQRAEAEGGREVVSLPPRRPVSSSDAAEV